MDCAPTERADDDHALFADIRATPSLDLILRHPKARVWITGGASSACYCVESSPNISAERSLLTDRVRYVLRGIVAEMNDLKIVAESH